jgi:hypothetical protein
LCGSKGIRTPDPLHAMQVRYRAAPWTPVVANKGNSVRLLHPDTSGDTEAAVRVSNLQDWQVIRSDR